MVEHYVEAQNKFEALADEESLVGGCPVGTTTLKGEIKDRGNGVSLAEMVGGRGPVEANAVSG
eukprot:5554301-Pyramimonas_sp.AAC.1